MACCPDQDLEQIGRSLSPKLQQNVFFLFPSALLVLLVLILLRDSTGSVMSRAISAQRTFHPRVSCSNSATRSSRFKVLNLSKSVHNTTKQDSLGRATRAVRDEKVASNLTRDICTPQVEGLSASEMMISMMGRNCNLVMVERHLTPAIPGIIASELGEIDMHSAEIDSGGGETVQFWVGVVVGGAGEATEKQCTCAVLATD
ncbi:hypothetical protein V8F33_004549 [Rhypophila sp. PSN 637]